MIPPASGVLSSGPMERVDGVEPGYMLTISRSRVYKHTEQICEAGQRLYEPERLVVVGGRHVTAGWLGVSLRE